MVDPLQEIQNKIKKLEDHVKRLQGTNKEWRDKYYSTKNKLDKIKSHEINDSELDQFKLENSKLRVELNRIKRDNRAAEKLAKIEEIIKRK